MNLLKRLFLLQPEIIFLNHGSFGACPRPVMAAYQSWQYEMERQPVDFLGRRGQGLLAEARTRLADYLSIAASEIVYFTNPTTAINMVARSLALNPGDEILISDHEYGAMERTWRFICRKTGARYVRQAIPLPAREEDNIVEAMMAGVNEKTRVIFISHITSPTGLTFPVKEICRRARQAGILSIVDGAHATGQIPLNLAELGADLYTGACHKWLCAPKGSAFLYASKEVQAWLDPLVVSWGYESEHPSESQFIDYHEWQGTRDLAAFLSVPAAIDFQEEYHWERVRQECHTLASETRRRINELTGLEPICPDSPDWFGQMFTARLPEQVDTENLKQRLFEQFHIEVPVFRWNDQPFMRVSIQGYNSQAEAEALVAALGKLLAKTGG